MKIQIKRSWYSYRSLHLVLAFTLMLVSSLVFMPFTRADSVINDWSWTTPVLLVETTAIVTDVDNQYCSGLYSYMNVYAEESRWICIKQSDHVKVGMKTEGRNFRTFVQFPFDTQMYAVTGTGSCEVHGECIYVPESDLLITKQNLINSIVRSLVIYKNFTKRLSQTINDRGVVSSYKFDDSNPDYVFKSSSNYPWPVEALGVSNNGKWLAVEFRQRGFGKLNLDTFTMTRYSTEAFSYTGGSDVTPELAITNNGNHVAMMGTNYRRVLTIDIGLSCEDEASDRNLEFVIPMAKTCKRLVNNTSSFMDNFWSAHNPQFNNDGTELSFYATGHGGGLKAVTMVVDGYIRPRVDYLALGDSFTSGEGEVDDSYYQKGTNDEHEKCHISTRSYPYLIAQTLGLEKQYVHNVACSGAKTSDVIGKDSLYKGQDSRLSHDTSGIDDNIRTIYQSESMGSFIPGRIHQESFVQKYKPNVITIGIGGNDIGFSDKLRTCVGFDSCEWASTPEGREKTALEIQNSFGSLVNTYITLKNTSPNSKIYAIGYPNIIDENGTCSFVNAILLDGIERTFITQAVHYINQVIQSAAKKAGVAYIDIENSFGDKVLCGDKKPSYMNAVKVGDDSPIFSMIGWLKLIGSESFHPKPSGHQAVATSILNDRSDMLNYDYCATQTMASTPFCPNNTIIAPEPSDYWIASGVYHGYPAQHIANFVRNSSDTFNNHKEISTEEYMFAPGSTVSVEIHSTPIPLGSSTANDTGTISLSVDLPQELGEGYHTIHLLGTSYSGQPIDLYQVIKYELPYTEVSEVNSARQQDSSSSGIEVTDEGYQKQTDTPNKQGVNDVKTSISSNAIETNTGFVGSLPSNPTKAKTYVSSSSLLLVLIPAGLWIIAGIILEVRARIRER